MGKGKFKKGEKPKDGAGKGDSHATMKSTYTPEGLDTFYYGKHSMGAGRFKTAENKLLDKLRIEYPGAAYVVEFGKERDFNKLRNLVPPAEDAKLTEDQNHALLDIYVKKEQEINRKELKYKDEIYSGFGVLYACCDTSMRQKLKEERDYTDICADRDLLKLWNLVKKFGLSDGLLSNVNRHYLVDEAVERFRKVHQYRNESVQVFFERFQQEVAIAESVGVDMYSSGMLAEAATKLPPGDANDVDKQKAKARDMHLAVVFLRKLHESDYQPMLNDLNNAYINGRDEFPKSLADSFRYACDWIAPRKPTYHAGAVNFHTTAKDAGKGKSGHQGGRQGTDSRTCFNCKQVGHIASNCPLTKEVAKDVTDKSAEKTAAKPNATVGVNKGSSGGHSAVHVAEEATLVADSKVDGEEVEEALEDIACMFSMVGHSFSEATKAIASLLSRCHILADNQSTVNIFNNAKLLTNIRKAERPMTIKGIGGELTATLVGDFGGFGVVYYHPDALANVLSFADLSKKYKVSYDNDKGDYFEVDTGKTIIRFLPLGKLYAFDSRKRSDHEVVMLQTVAGNMSSFTVSERQRAEEARDLYIKLARPAEKDFRSMIKNGGILNSRVTLKDVDRAQFIWGKDLGAIKGRTTRDTPPAVIMEPREKKPEPLPLIMAADLGEIEGERFMFGVTKKLNVITACHVKSKNRDQLFSAVTKAVKLYSLYGFLIDTLKFDGESGLAAARDDLEGLGIRINQAVRGEHVPEIERVIRLIKERVRGLLNTLPFALPRTAIIYAVYYCVMMINMTPKNGEAESARERLTGDKFDVKRFGRLMFGSYCQVYIARDHQNGMESRTDPAICLGPVGNQQGAYHFLNLRTKAVIAARQWEELPVTEDVIKFMNDWAAAEGVTYHSPPTRNPPAGRPKKPRRTSRPQTAAQGNPHHVDPRGEAPHPAEDVLAEVGGAGNDRRDFKAEENLSSDDEETEENDEDEDESDDDAETVKLELDTGVDDGSLYWDAEEGESDDDDSDYEPSDLSDGPDPDPGPSHRVRTRGSLPPFEEMELFDRDQGRSLMMRAGAQKSRFKLQGSDVRGPEIDSCLAPVPAEAGELSAYEAIVNRPPVSLGVLRAVDPLPLGMFPGVDVRKGNKKMKKRMPTPYWYAHAEDLKEFHVLLTVLTASEGLKKHGRRGLLAMTEEINQIIQKGVIDPVRRSSLDGERARRIMRSSIHLKEKRDGRLKARMCSDGRTQRFYVSAEDTSSPTVRTESVMVSLVIDAMEHRYVVVADIEGAYLAVEMTAEEYMEMNPNMSAIAMALRPEWEEYKDSEGKLVFRLRKALYGCVQSAKLFYEHLSRSLKSLGFEPNPYDPCVFNCEKYGVQCTATIHVDDLKVSCKDRRGVDETIKGLEAIYKNLSVKTGPTFDYLGMEIDFSKPGVVTVGSRKLLAAIVEKFPEVPVAKSPAAEHLFDKDRGTSFCQKLDRERADEFRSVVASILYDGKHGRPDLLTAASYLATRVTEPDEDDWKKLLRVIGYIKGTLDLLLHLSATSVDQFLSSIDAAFGVHMDGKSHTGVFITLGCGAVFGKSVKQKLVSQSSCEAELIALAEGVNIITWFRHFLEAQGFKLKPTVVQQDNQSTILLAKQGKLSQRTRHVNIRFFAVKEKIDNGKILIVYTPTEEMAGDFFTKPLQGSLFVKLRNKIMGIACSEEIPAGKHPVAGVCSAEQEAAAPAEGSDKKKAATKPARPPRPKRGPRSNLLPLDTVDAGIPAVTEP